MFSNKILQLTNFPKVKYFKTFLILILALSFTAPVVNAQESRLPQAPIYIDGEPINTRYIMRDGHMLVPAIFLKHTGAYVDWNEPYRSVVFQAKDKRFSLPVGKKYLDDYNRATNTWERHLLPIETMDYAGDPFVPLVNVAKKLDMNVRYDANSARTYITTNITVKSNSLETANTKEKLAALTFDDGPDSRYTPQILDILKEKAAPATFFVMGKQVKAFPEQLKRMVNEGHGIANHTWNHPDLRSVWSDQVREEIRTTQKEMERVTGRKPDLFRPPYGAFTKADIRIFNELGMRNMMWSVDTLDYAGLSGEEILEIVHQKISPGGIILQHNFQSGTPLLDGTVEALPKIIDELRDKGYKFVTLQTLLTSQNQ